MIIISSLHRDYLPSSWSNFVATVWDNAILFGSIGVFITLFALFRTVSAHDFDVRSAQLVAVFESGRREREMTKQDRLYGIVAEFDNPEALVDAAPLAPPARFPQGWRLTRLTRSNNWKG